MHLATVSILPLIETEDALPILRPDLKTVLLHVAKGYAELAANSTDLDEKKQMVELTERVMRRLDNRTWVPTTMWKRPVRNLACIRN